MSYQGHYVRDYLHAQQGGCCDICGMRGNWNGVTLAMIIDHIDGDAANNRRTNLRLICPNCDSQLPTYKAKNRGKGRYYRRLEMWGAVLSKSTTSVDGVRRPRVYLTLNEHINDPMTVPICLLEG